MDYPDMQCLVDLAGQVLTAQMSKYKVGRRGVYWASGVWQLVTGSELVLWPRLLSSAIPSFGGLVQFGLCFSQI